MAIRRWWRSRDLGRIDAGGYLYLEGRRDDMIISGGINIMPARVEEVLLAHRGVAECAVVGVPDPEWGERVQAFIVRADPALDAKMLEQHVRASDLSAYQRPRTYTFVAELPRTLDQQGAAARAARNRAAGHSQFGQSIPSISIDRKKMSETEKIFLVERQGPIAIVTLNRPDKRNALSEKLWSELKTTFENFEPDVRCVVLAGAGKHFCAGLDLSEHRHREAFDSIFMSRFAHATLDAIQFGGRPVVTAMQGAVIGGGLEVATATHVRVADPTTFYQLPEGRRGFYVGGGASVRVAKIIGSGRMVEMMLTGRTLDAAAGERLGLSHYLVEPGKTLEKADRACQHHRQECAHPELFDRAGHPAHRRHVGLRRAVDRKRRASGQHDFRRCSCRHRCVSVNARSSFRAVATANWDGVPAVNRFPPRSVR